MRKKYVRIFFLLLLFGLPILQCFGQDIDSFPMNNATWTMDVQSQSLAPPYPSPISHSYIYFKTNGDTLINGKTYTKIDKYCSPNYCFIREEDKNVFCKYNNNSGNDTTEFLLYNFNLNIGDSIKIPRAEYIMQYDDGYVTEIDSLLIGSKYHKRIRISSTYGGFDFVEGVGALQGLLYPEIPLVDFANTWGDLICFSVNDTIYELSGTGNTSIGDCWQTISVQDNENKIIKVYPNPFHDYIAFEGLQKHNYIEIYDVNSKLIYCKTIMRTGNIKINAKRLPSGIYFIKTSDKDGRIIFTRKIIKF